MSVGIPWKQITWDLKRSRFKDSGNLGYRNKMSSLGKSIHYTDNQLAFVVRVNQHWGWHKAAPQLQWWFFLSFRETGKEVEEKVTLMRGAWHTIKLFKPKELLHLPHCERLKTLHHCLDFDESQETDFCFCERLFFKVSLENLSEVYHRMWKKTRILLKMTCKTV